MRRWCKEKKNGKKNQVEMVYVEDGSGQEGRMWIANWCSREDTDLGKRSKLSSGGVSF